MSGLMHLKDCSETGEAIEAQSGSFWKPLWYILTLPF